MTDDIQKTLKEIEAFKIEASKSAKEAENARVQSEKYLNEITDFIIGLSKLADLKRAAEKKEPQKKGQHLNEYLDNYNYYSGKASEISRSLSLAGTAIVWIFKYSDTPIPFLYVTPRIPQELFWPLSLLALSLAFDLIQYLLGTILWEIFYDRNSKRWESGKLTDEQVSDMHSPKSITIPLEILFYVKIALTVAAYVLLVIFLYQKLRA